ncbi:MAG: DUF5686 and carboxypeptidase regulatory-like domain-containing protein [Chitinophagales bacterium]
MRRNLLILCFLLSSCISFAGKISGVITDDKGQPLPYASILVKGTTRGTTANNEGKYFLNLEPGTYTIVCQHVGYSREEKTISVVDETVTLNFQLHLQELTLSEVIVKKGEDPAYEIIRQAIKKRTYYQQQLSDFRCEVYTKGQLRLRDFPKKFMGLDVDFEDHDTSKRKTIYLSETIAAYYVQKPDKRKVEVLSSKVSGQSDGYGLSAPEIYSFYDNNIKIGANLNPRGFISPISANALNYYRYRFEGSFFEDGKEIGHIKVMPKRKYEPLFSGYINIVIDEWRIHSVQLQLTKESQMELADTLKLDQLYVPYDQDVWVIKSQVVYPTIKIFGFDAYGSFVNMYSKFDLNPKFDKNFFSNTVLKYDDSSNKKTEPYWETVRPIPLQQEESEDYKKKDSLEQARKDPKYLDSIDRKHSKLTVMKLLVSGYNINRQKTRSLYSFSSLLNSVNFNTVEGLVVNLNGSYSKRLDTTLISHRSFSISPSARYGFSNHHFNSSVSMAYNFGKKYFNAFSISGGKKVFQFNNASPIPPEYNTISTLEWERNYMKIYEAWFARIGYSKTLDEGFNVSIDFQYQDRIPLDNTTDYTWRNRKNIVFTPNYPTELTTTNFKRHQAFIATAGISWQPGNKYVELPGRKFSIGSKYPHFSFNYTSGIKNIFGSDIKYDKWQFAITDGINLKLAGVFNYVFTMGGFLNHDSVNIPDYTHFNGNQLFIATPYLNSFQLAPYYKYSNTESFYTSFHAEYHFNGFLTNKIPLFRRLNWHLVGGTNAFYVNKKNNYAEAFAGLENIFKILRIDGIWGFEEGRRPVMGFRIGLHGIFTRGVGE